MRPSELFATFDLFDPALESVPFHISASDVPASVKFLRRVLVDMASQRILTNALGLDPDRTFR